MSSIVFVANQLHKFYPSDTLIKIGVATAFLKDKSTDYKFGGAIYYENDDVIIFKGLPKIIEVDGENMIELFQYQNNNLLSLCCELKQQDVCTFKEYHFEYKDKVYYNIEDVEKLINGE